MMSVDVTNHNGPAATPPTSLSLRSSHNQLLDCDVTQQGSATPPKCRKKYALTSIQAAMGLGEGVSSLPVSSPSQSPNPSNPKVAKNGVNQLRKAGQDHNKNTTSLEPMALECSVEMEIGGVGLDKAEENVIHMLTTKGREEDLFKQGTDSHGEPELEEKHELQTDSNINTIVELKLNGNTTDLGFNVNVEGDENDDISNLCEKEIILKLKIEQDGDELEVEEHEDEEKNPLLMIKNESTGMSHKVSNFKLHRSDNDSPGPPPPRLPKQASPEDMPLLSVASCSSSCSSSSSPDTKKDRRTGAKTDCALNRIQNLNPSDEELSWTTLSQESNSPEETGTCTQTHRTCNTIIFSAFSLLLLCSHVS